MKLVDPLDCAQFQILNAVLHNTSTSPSSPAEAQLWYLSGTHAPMYFNGTQPRPLDAKFLTDGSIQNTALATNPLDRGNHINTQLAATISNLKTTVTGYTLDLFASPIATVNAGTQRITNAANATTGTDLVPLAQVNALITAAVQGQTAIKPPVRTCAPGNINLSAPGAAIDGVTMNVSDRFLAQLQSTPTQNNIYIWNGASASASAASDSASGSQWVEGTDVLVNEGTTYGGAIFRQTTSGSITIGTNALMFTQTFKINVYTADGVTANLIGQQFSVKYDTITMTTATGSLGVNTTRVPQKFSATITGDGTTTAFNVTHGLGTTDVIVGLRDASGNKVFSDDNPINTGTLTVTFGQPPAAGVTYRVTVQG